MKRPEFICIASAVFFLSTASLFAEDASASHDHTGAPVSHQHDHDDHGGHHDHTEDQELSEQELHEMFGYLSALGGGVSSLELSEAGITEMAEGLRKALSGELTIESVPESEVQAALGEAQARAEAVQQSKEDLPAFSEGSLEKLALFVFLQSGFKELGFDASQADAICEGFIEGANDKEIAPERKAKMPAFQNFVRGRIEEAQAARAAEREKAQKAAMAQFQAISDEWKLKENINVVLETTQGDIELELYPEHAPLAVANFVGHIENGYYNDIIFHRVIDEFMIQGGDPKGQGTGGESIWGKPFPDEFSDELRFNEKGLLAMANSGPMTNGSQFFITTSKPHWLNDKHTIFGKVVEGYDNVVKIEKVETDARDKPVETQKIIKAYVKE